MRTTRRAATVGAVLGVVAVLALGCSSDDAGSSRPATPSSNMSSTTAVAAEPAATDQPFTEVATAIDGFVTREGLNGAALVVVERNGGADGSGVVWQHYTGAFGPDRPSLIASSSKMLTAGVLLRLQDKGLIDLDAPVADAVPWGSSNPSLTVAQLLSNSSGLPGLVDGPMYAPYLCQYLPTGTLTDCGRTIFTSTDDDALVVPPDTRFRYGGGQWQVAGAVAEAVSNKSWAELIDETYVEPCGVRSLAFNNHFAQITSPTGPFSYPTEFDGDPSVLAPTDNPNMEGGAYVTPLDYAALLRMHLRGGRCGKTRVLSEAAVDQAHTDRIGEFGTGGDDEGYGLGWWIDRDDTDRQQDGGAFGAEPWIDLDRGYAAFLVLEATSGQGQALMKEIRPMVDRIMDERASRSPAGS